MRLVGLLVCLVGCGGLDSFNATELDSGLDAGVDYGGLVFSRSAIDFGFLSPGQSATQTLTLTNEGTESITLEQIESVGSSVFSIDNLTGGPAVLAVNEELALTVRFEPDATEDFVGAVALDTSLVEAPYIEILLNGTGINPNNSAQGNIQLSQNRVSFGQVGLNTTATQALTLQNTGESDIALSSIAFSDSAFGWERDLNLPYVIRAGSQETVTLNYSPTEEIQHSGTATISVDDPNAPELTVDLSGEGIYDCSACEPIISTDSNYELTDFFVLVGMGSDDRSVMIQNTGDQPLNIQNVYINNDLLFTGGTFSVSGFNGPTTLDPWESTYITVSFTAASSGIELDLSALDQNTVHIISNGSNEPDYMITLSGAAL